MLDEGTEAVFLNKFLHMTFLKILIPILKSIYHVHITFPRQQALVVLLGVLLAVEKHPVVYSW